ncbi:helix-turn-helix domain-containing protein [Brevundimonas alba]|uniref:helix-turn-helix domain-containing protein n=1 Tax=Brevundimonas alba TaxID=74314 RepID=UPI003CC91DE4
MTISEACRRLEISRSTFYNLVAEGKIPLRKVGGSSRVRSDELDDFIQDLPRLAAVAAVEVRE